MGQQITSVRRSRKEIVFRAPGSFGMKMVLPLEQKHVNCITDVTLKFCEARRLAVNTCARTLLSSNFSDQVSSALWFFFLKIALTK